MMSNRKVTIKDKTNNFYLVISKEKEEIAFRLVLTTYKKLRDVLHRFNFQLCQSTRIVLPIKFVG